MVNKKDEADNRSVLTPKQLKEAKRVLKKHHHCGLCNDFFESDYELAKHIVEEHGDMVKML